MVDLVALLERAPEGVRRAAYRVARGQGPLGRMVDAVRFRVNPQDVPQVPAFADASRRVLIGPANSAGQGYQWARAVERNVPDAVAVAMHGIGVDPFRPDVDLSVPIAVYQRSKEWHDAFEDYLSTRTHVLWESGLPLMGRRYREGVLGEMQRMQQCGVKRALMFHGSDIRPPSRHAEQHPWSPFRRPTGPARALEDTAARNAELAAAAEVPVFFSTPDLLQWLPEATWCPVVVEPARWRVTARAEHGSRPLVVAHAPSQKWLKGTDIIEPILRRLESEGVIEYRQILNVPHSQMPAFYAEADVVLDQFVLGIYGVAACEAMAAGRIVMSHVDEFTRNYVRTSTGFELPIHEVTIETLEAELRRAAATPSEFHPLREAGPVFVDATHDGRRSAAALAGFLD